jgi:limonene-1,2-epoxide hydrolase
VAGKEGDVKAVRRLVEAINAHDLDAMVDCFADGYVNETPAHPMRDFTGNEQVRTNWGQIFGRIPDVHAEVVRSVLDGRLVWTEWDMAGTRADGVPFAMRGVVIFGIDDDRISSARFYLEPVEVVSGDVNAGVRRVTGAEGSSR